MAVSVHRHVECCMRKGVFLGWYYVHKGLLLLARFHFRFTGVLILLSAFMSWQDKIPSLQGFDLLSPKSTCQSCQISSCCFSLTAGPRKFTKKPETYSSRDSLVVTHPTTNLPISSLCKVFVSVGSDYCNYAVLGLASGCATASKSFVLGLG